MSDTVTMLGKIHETKQQRDAVHIAVAPVVAGERLAPGQHVGFEKGSTETVAGCGTFVGIIDPLLYCHVEAGQKCFLWLYPNTITSLRHEWTHPAFGAVAAVETSESRKVIEKIADVCGLSYGRLMDAARLWVEGSSKGDDYNHAYNHAYTHMGENEDYKNVENWEEFWKAYEDVTGTKVKDHCGYFFTCSC